MSNILKISNAGGIGIFTRYNDMLAGNTPYISGDYENIQTILINGATSSITFSNIPQNYKHLQIRILAQTNRATYNIDGLRLRFNGDSGNNYSYHSITADPTTGGTTVGASYSSAQSNILFGQVGTTVATNVFGVSIVDLLDYANNTKYKTLRALSGVETNGGAGGYSGYNGLYSGAWINFNSIYSINIYSDTSSSIQQFSSFALYGIKG